MKNRLLLPLLLCASLLGATAPIQAQTTIPIVTYRGTYASGTTYGQGALVFDGSGNAYISKIASNTGNTPSSNPSDWQPFLGGGGSYTLTLSAVLGVFTAPSGSCYLKGDGTCGTPSGGGSGGTIPTGTGFTHITTGAQDSVARAVNLASADVTGLLPNANIANPSTTVNGVACTLGASCSPPGTVTPTTGDLIVSTKTSGQLTSLRRIAGLIGIGDSYVQGVGVPNQTLDSWFAKLVRDTPTSYWQNFGHQGDTTPQIAYKGFGYITYDATYPFSYANDGGLNDGNTDACGGTAGTNCIKNYQLSMRALVVRESVPELFRIYGSNATASGSTASDGTIPLASPLNGIVSYGGAKALTAASASLTFAVPTSASPVVYVTYAVTNGNSATFHVSVDGSLVTDACSGTTTFTNGPCGGQALVQTTSAPFTQEFSVTAGATHTVVVTALTAATTIPIISVDWVPASSTSNLNAVFMTSSPPASGFPYAAIYSTAAATVINQLNTDGLPAFFVDLVTGTPGANNAIDYAQTATTTCEAGVSGGHPNNCGHEAIEQTVFNAEVQNGWQFSSFNAGGEVVYRTGRVAVPLDVSLQDNGLLTSIMNNMNATNAYNTVNCNYAAGGAIFGCTGFLVNGSNASGFPWTGANSTVIGANQGWVTFDKYSGSTTSAASNWFEKGGVDLSTGNTVFLGVDSRQVGTAIASASTISPLHLVTHITGTTAISTITLPANFSSTFGGCLALIADGASSTTTGGNIANAVSFTGGTLHNACYDGTSWYIQ